jgi:hypothetical protein
MRTFYHRGRLTAEQVSTLERAEGWRWRLAQPPADFDRMLRLLRKYARREGHARVLRDHVESGIRLGQWVGVQRTAYREGRILRERRRALEAVPGWSWQVAPTPKRVEFERAHAALRRFAKREGHARVPYDYREAGIALGQWVVLRRVDFRKGRLAADQVRRLERLPGWTWDPGRERFQQMLALLHRFVSREGHARVPFAHQEAGVSLGLWVCNRRMAYRRGTLSKVHVDALELVPGWTWNAGRRQDLDRVLRALATFVRREGHARVPRGHTEHGLRLGLWVSHQRQSFHRGRLSHTLAWRLERFQGWSWDPATDRSDRMLALLRGYVKREGHAWMRCNHVEEGAKLGRWLETRRAAFRQGRLPREQVTALRSILGRSWHESPSK